MTSEQVAKFYRWLGKPAGSTLNQEHRMFWNAWDSCLRINNLDKEEQVKNEPIEATFKIGEEVEFLLDTNEGWKRAHIGLILLGEPEVNFNVIRRVPAWTPKESEAVLFPYGPEGLAHPGVFAGGKIRHGLGSTWPMGNSPISGICKPFDASKIGKPWSEL